MRYIYVTILDPSTKVKVGKMKMVLDIISISIKNGVIFEEINKRNQAARMGRTRR